MAKKQSSTVALGIGLGCLFLFGLPFALVGLLMDLLLVRAGYEEVRSLTWKAVPCTILSAELAEEKGSKSTNYRTKATYQYEVDGKSYTSHRVASVEAADNVGPYQKQIFAELEQYRASGKPFRCYVNPFKAEEAILYHQGNWALISLQTLAGLLFSGVGFSIVAVAIVGWFEQRKLAPADPSAELQPWQTRADWAKGEIRHSDRRLSQFLLWGSFGIALISIPSLVAGLLEIVLHHTPLAALAFLPMAVSMLVLLLGWRARARWRRYGDSVLQMASVPGVLGGTFAAVVSIERTVIAPDGFQVRLVCTETTQKGSGDDKTTHTEVVWEQQQIVSRDLRSSEEEGSNIPVLFTLPYDAPETDDATSTGDYGRKHAWRLSIHATVPGIDYHAEFEVPVFRTAESDPHFKPDPTLVAEYQVPADSNLPLKNAGLTIEPYEGEGFTIGFPRFRAIGFAIAMMIVQVVFVGAITGACFYFWHVAWPYVACFFGYFLFLSIVDLFFYYSAIDVTKSMLRIRSGSFYVGGPIEVAATDIDKFIASAAGSAGNTTAYDLAVHLKNGKIYNLGKRIIPKSVVDDIIRRTEKMLEKPAV